MEEIAEEIEMLIELKQEEEYCMRYHIYLDDGAVEVWKWDFAIKKDGCV